MSKARSKARRDHYAQLPRHPLLLCAALVQNPANLGGLCRTAEAFRLEGLVLSDLAIAHTAPFRNLAVSTQHWQPVLCCPPAALPDWIAAQQQHGVQIIALDADPIATPITTFTFPQQAVLMLGQELTGIPANILAQCDYTITIPQWGWVESLNVQTAAAIAIYEYTRQHPLSSGLQIN